MSHKIYHGLDQETAKKVSEKAIETYTKKFQRYNPQFQWVDDTSGNLTFNYKGTKLGGKVSIVGPYVVIDLKVPFLLKMFTGPALQAIETEVNTWVDGVKNGTIVL